jgi:squalene synthase HpnC
VSPITPPAAIETPSGKDAGYENFPVGSWLLPRELRPEVAIFYAFARAADDIADNPDLGPDDKVARLDAFEAALLGRDVDKPGLEKSHHMHASLARTGVAVQHCVDLLAAFKQDAVKHRYRDWDDLIAYCRLSAAAVGRYMVDLHGGSRDGYAPSDALCMALQIINHVQDCQEDYRLLDRVYLPQDWMIEYGAAAADLDAPATGPALAQVLRRTLAGVEGLLADAAPMPAGLRSRRLSMESAAILNIAWRLTGLLRRRDPLAGRIQLSKAGYIWCCIRGVVSAGLRGPSS